eukprot:2068593-Pleurochrysis_carterae.AAC.1
MAKLGRVARAQPDVVWGEQVPGGLWPNGNVLAQRTQEVSVELAAVVVVRRVGTAAPCDAHAKLAHVVKGTSYEPLKSSDKTRGEAYQMSNYSSQVRNDIVALQALIPPHIGFHHQSCLVAALLRGARVSVCYPTVVAAHHVPLKRLAGCRWNRIHSGKGSAAYIAAIYAAIDALNNTSIEISLLHDTDRCFQTRRALQPAWRLMALSPPIQSLQRQLQRTCEAYLR